MTCASFNHDGSLLLTGSMEGNIRFVVVSDCRDFADFPSHSVWSTADGTQVCELDCSDDLVVRP